MHFLGSFFNVTESGLSVAIKVCSWAHFNQVVDLMTLLVFWDFYGRVWPAFRTLEN